MKQALQMRNLVNTLLASVPLVGAPAAAQVKLDRADPSIAERALPASPVVVAPLPTPIVSPSVVPEHSTIAPRIASAIVVTGNADIPTSAFAHALFPYIGRDLTGKDLSQLAGAVAGVARNANFPLATATIEPQSLADGILRVTLDEGHIDAVRVIGATSPIADRILTSALVTEVAVRKDALERAILLVGDIPGITVKGSKYVRQDGFGILLVTLNDDRASAYAQLDNRGSAEVGPIRSTILASLRGFGQSGDELGIVAALTPVEPAEFAFFRARYSMPLGSDGGVATVSGSYGRAHPGASLSQLKVLGHSADLEVGYALPLLRSRAHSLWASAELKALKSGQSLLGNRLRDDRITMLTGALNGAVKFGPGALRGEVAIVGGLPVAGVTHAGDLRTSRSDGDARFVTLGYTLDWTAGLTGPFTIVLASSGQLASRPLLATAEIGAGGPAFGRGYDYSERTGDQGVVASAEIRADLGRLSDAVSRAQVYGFLDGGYVDNLRNVVGDGSLVSTGTGMRVGLGPVDAMVEVAFPLNEDRFDTGTKRPRVSFRLARSF